MKTLLSFGHGFSARALTRILPDDWTVIGTTRSADKADALTAEGVDARVWPGTDITADLDRATHLLISAGPSEDGDPVLNEIKSEVAARRDQFEWVGYLSTTGTYGDHGGAWIDESTPVKPTTERGEWRARAEAEWQSLDLPLHIFRLAGIYGPGRGPFAKVRSGKARRIIKEGQVFSRTHVDDIAQVLLASINKPNPGAAYNVCDDEPAPPQDVIEFAANLLGLPVPPAIPIEDAPMTPMAASFYAENKRVRNDRIKDELGVKLLYPDYRTGLRALLAQSGE